MNPPETTPTAPPPAAASEPASNARDAAPPPTSAPAYSAAYPHAPWIHPYASQSPWHPPPPCPPYHPNPLVRCFYAVRKGKNVDNCLFFDERDFRRQTAGISAAEYHVADSLPEAAAYILSALYLPSAGGGGGGLLPISEERVSPPRWRARLAEMRAFVEESGHSYPKEGERKELHRWAAAQRREYARFQRGETSQLTEEGVGALKEAGFEFSRKRTRPDAPPSEDQETRWQAMFRAFQDYRNANGHCCVASKENYKLYTWIKAQRKEYQKLKNGEASELNEERADRLKEAGFDFTGKRRQKPPATEQDEKLLHEKWDAMCATVDRYIRQHGAIKFHRGQKLDQDAAAVRSWFETQRKEYKKAKEGRESRLSAAQIVRLNDMGIVFRVREAKKTFDEWYEELRAFQDVHGHCRVPRSREVPDGLAIWIARMRSEYKQVQKGDGDGVKLTLEQIQRLDKLGMKWEIIKQKPSAERSKPLPWSGRFRQLLEFKEAHGHMNVPQHYPGLGLWVKQQRNDYKLLQKGVTKAGFNFTHEKALQLANYGFNFEVMPRKNKVEQAENPSPASTPAPEYETELKQDYSMAED